MKRRDDSVFFFTIVDFLVVSIFLGLVLFMLKRDGSDTELGRANTEIKRLEELAKKSGAGNVRELTDRLSRLGPVSDIEHKYKQLDSAGGIAELLKTQTVVAELGGRDSVQKVMSKLGRDGVGLPPCLADTVNGRRNIRRLAAVVADDSTLRFTGTNPSLDTVLATLGRSYASVEHLSFAAFRRAFDPLLARRPDCRYSLRLIERTHMVYARDALTGVFYFTPERGR